MLIKLITGFGSQLRSMWMVFSHAFRKRDTIQYPEAEGLSAAALPWSHRSDP
jgi:formate hydrogenlyase subunit 6/NADH:ubiquinone oxidoreductase subunit I